MLQQLPRLDPLLKGVFAGEEVVLALHLTWPHGPVQTEPSSSHPLPMLLAFILPLFGPLGCLMEHTGADALLPQAVLLRAVAATAVADTPAEAVPETLQHTTNTAHLEVAVTTKYKSGRTSCKRFMTASLPTPLGPLMTSTRG
jgi:hypothetical protein